MSDGMVMLLGLLLMAIIISLFWVFIRVSYAFKSIFGVFPKKATQEMVDKKIQELQKALANEVPVPGSRIDDDIAGYNESKLERAKKLAKKYGFSVSE